MQRLTKHRITLTLLCAGLALGILSPLSGCKNMDVLLNGGHSSAERRVTNLAGVLDRPLVDAFYQLSADGQEESLPPAFTAEKFLLARLEPSAIYLDKVLHVSLTSSLADIRGRVNQDLRPRRRTHRARLT